MSENLKKHQFQSGQSGNPNGRPKGRKSLKTLIEAFLDHPMTAANPLTGETGDLTVEQRLVLAQIGVGLKGDTKAFKEIMDRMYGKAVNTHEIGGIDGEPLMPLNIVVQGVEGGEKPADAK